MVTIFVVWINIFIKILNLNLNQEPIQLYWDNQTAISLMKNGAVSSRSKHIMVKCYYIYKMIENNEIIVDYMLTNDMIADPLIKGISEELF